MNPGDPLADYVINQPLGQGGMGEVYLAEDSTGSKVAVKVMREDIAHDLHLDFRERFQRERKALDLVGKLHHTNIVRLLDSGVFGSLCFFVMEYVPGGCLRKLMDGGSIPLRQIVQIVIQICDGLAAAHSLGIIHRDIKPENVLMNGTLAKVGDFGIALVSSTAERTKLRSLTSSGVGMGTPDYMSPEQRSNAHHVGAPSDLYSLGVVLYELILKKPPRGVFPLPSSIHDRSTDLDRIVLKLLQDDSRLRYQEAVAVRTDLENVLHRLDETIEGLLDQWRTESIAHCVLLINREGKIIASRGALDEDCTTEALSDALATFNDIRVELGRRLADEEPTETVVRFGRDRTLGLFRLGDAPTVATVFNQSLEPRTIENYHLILRPILKRIREMLPNRGV